MCYFIGIEDLAANALIELVEKNNKRSVSFKQLNAYGDFVLAKLKENNTEASLIFSRDRTNQFIHDCSVYFTISETEDDFIVELKDTVSTAVLRQQFRINTALQLLKIFVSPEALGVLING